MSKAQEKIDERFMAAAVRLARRNLGRTGTNPSVACILVREDNGSHIIVGSGVTSIGGRPHAEPIALKQAGDLAKGATAYVTLEPCAHHGATPPCAATLIDAGVARVVTGHVDPDPRVNSLGHKMLEEAGIEVKAGCLDEFAREVLAPYLNRKQNNRSYVTVKIAVSPDGLLGIKNQGQVTVTGPQAKAYTHMIRARHHAILVGAQTVIEDDPDLTCRLEGLEHRSPIRIILDPNGRVPLSSKLFQSAKQFKTMVTAPHSISSDRKKELSSLGVEILNCDIANGQIALPELMEDLSSIGIVNLMVEGGANTVLKFLEAELVDEFHYYEGTSEIGSKHNVSNHIVSPTSIRQLEKSFTFVSRIKLGEDHISVYKHCTA